MPGFVHLHTHTEFSLLDGMARIDDLLTRARELGQSALAVTDHGVMFSAIQFYTKAKKRGIKPIIGCEMYIAPRGMHQKEAKVDSSPHHLILLARNDDGYRNLMRIATAGQLEGFYYRPRVDKDFLQEHTGGLIALSACASGEIPRLIQQGQTDKAREVAQWYHQAFGAGHFYLELQRHEALPELESVNRELIKIAREQDIPLVATNDIHYVRKEHARVQEILLCIQTNTTIRDPKHMTMGGESFYMRSTEEMAALFADAPDALENTGRIADMCQVDLDFNGYHLPVFPVPDGYSPETYLAEECREGLRRRYPNVTPDLENRLSYELGVIHQMGFDMYFLIVWDLVRFAKSSGIMVGPGRGSAAGSIVSYCLGITELDPLSNGLIFERFLNPGRVNMPDIDMDFPDDRRDELIRYAMHKYGADRLAQIVTFGTMGARAAVRDAGRALDLPLPEVDRVAKLVPAGPKVSLTDALEQSPELRQMYDESDYIHELVDTALQLEGIARHASTHAAGVVIGDRPLVDYVPLHRATKGDSGPPVTQYDMSDIEYIGLVKMDFLGLSTLTIIRKALDNVAAVHGLNLVPEEIPLDDPEIYALLTSGDVSGLFQVESAGMRRVLTSLRPTEFEDIVAVLSLYRPGPMQFIDRYVARKHGEEAIEYIHPKLEPILKETYGIIVYQEQIIRMCTDLAGYSAGEADLMRRAVGKKKEQELLKHRGIFVKGLREKSGIEPEKGEEIFAAIEFFANYGFNKAHAACYAVLTCQTAYLKAHYPVEFMAAMLSVERGNTEKVASYIAECRRLGIQVLRPDVGRSGLDFTIETADCGQVIRFGLGAIKNVGEGPVQTILESRQTGGPFADLDDFCARVDLRAVNRRVIESLIKAGAMDGFGRREQLLEVIDRMMEVSAQKRVNSTQISMFSMPAFVESAANVILSQSLPDVPSIPTKQLLLWEKELIGLYVSDHPLQHASTSLARYITNSCTDVSEELAGQKVTVGGIVTSVRQIFTKNEKAMAFVQMEDLQGHIEIVVFPRLYEETRELWEEDKILLVTGSVDCKGGDAKLLADSVRDSVVTGRPSDDDESLPARRHLQLRLKRTGDDQEDVRLMEEVRGLLASYSGQDTYSVVVDTGDARVILEFPGESTGLCPELNQSLTNLLGTGAVRIT